MLFAAPGLFRLKPLGMPITFRPGIARHFAFENFICFEKEKIEAVLKEEKEKAASEVRTDCLARIIATSDLGSDASRRGGCGFVPNTGRTSAWRLNTRSANFV